MMSFTSPTIRSSRAFTLIELLVVISIIGLLSSVVLAGVNGARAKGSLAAGQNFDGHTYAAFYDDLVLSWDFDNDSGTTVQDLSGNGNTLTYTNPATLNSAINPFKSGKSFNMVSGATAQTGNMSNVPTGDFSISFWLYPTDVSASIDYLYAFSGTNDKSWRFSYTIGGPGFGFAYRMAGVTRTASVGALPLNAWHHIAAVCNNNMIGTYVNGKLITTAVLQSPGTCGGFLNTIPLEVGKNTSLSFYIDNIRIYKKPLPLSFIYSEYLAGLSKTEALARSMKRSTYNP